MNEKFRAEPIYLLPILASLVFGFLFTYLRLALSPDQYAVTPFPEGLIGSLGNGIYFVALAGVGASILYFLLKRRKLRIITFITGFALTAAAFLLSIVYLGPLFAVTDLSFGFLIVLALAGLVTAIFDYIIFKKNGLSQGFTILLLGGGLGAFLGLSIPPLSGVLILIFLAVYDVFAVFRGPVGKIAASGLDRLRGLSLTFRNVQIGLGDLTFYPMLISLTFTLAGPLYCLFSGLGVLVGSFLAFKMLERKGIFPGLPIPVALGLIPLLIRILV